MQMACLWTFMHMDVCTYIFMPRPIAYVGWREKGTHQRPNSFQYLIHLLGHIYARRRLYVCIFMPINVSFMPAGICRHCTWFIKSECVIISSQVHITHTAWSAHSYLGISMYYNTYLHAAHYCTVPMCWLAGSVYLTV